MDLSMKVGISPMIGGHGSKWCHSLLGLCIKLACGVPPSEWSLYNDRDA